MYHQQIESRKMMSGYAMDDFSGILFKNGKIVEAVRLNDVNNSYFVSLKNGKIYSEKLNSRKLTKRVALPPS